MRNFLITLALMLLVLAALLARPWLSFQQEQGVVPAGVRLAGLDLDGANADTVGKALASRFEEPVAVYYSGQRIILRPQVVGFRTDVPAMLAEAHAKGTTLREGVVFLGRMVGRPVAPLDVSLRYILDSAALDNWLNDIAARYDHAPLPPQPIVATLAYTAGQPGTQLDVPSSRERLVAALTNPMTRTVELTLHEVAAPPVDIKALQSLLQARMDQFPGIGALYLHQTNTGDEISINADVAFAGMSTMKIAILEEFYRKVDAQPDVETIHLITETTSLSGNYTANLLLGIIDDGDPEAGVRVVNNSLRTLGLKNTFMATPYDLKMPVPPHIITEANSRKDLSTNADPYMQTTPRDIGSMLEWIVECSQGGGTLLAAYPNQLTPAECQQALDYLALNEVHELITAGVPKGTRVVHKHGYVSDTHGDVAAVWSPAGPYVLSIYLYQPPWLEWSISSTTMKDLSTAVWNYFSIISGH
jgi:beta-lactamase class A